jgi:hypothetical protein
MEVHLDSSKVIQDVWGVTIDYLRLLDNNNIDYTILKKYHPVGQGASAWTWSILSKDEGYKLLHKEYENQGGQIEYWMNTSLYIIYDEKNWDKFTLCIKNLINTSIDKDYFKFGKSEKEYFLNKYGMENMTTNLDDYMYDEQNKIITNEIDYMFYKTPGWYVYYKDINNFKSDTDFLLTYSNGVGFRDIQPEPPLDIPLKISQQISNHKMAHSHHGHSFTSLTDLTIGEKIPHQYCSYLGSKLINEKQKYINWIHTNPLNLK